MPARGGIAFSTEALPRLGLIDFYRRCAATTQEVAIGILERKILSLLKQLGVEKLDCTISNMKEIYELTELVQQDSAVSAGYSSTQLQHRVELQVIADDLSRELEMQGGYAFVLTTSPRFARLERYMLGENDLPHVVPGLMMFCLAEALHIDSDLVEDLQQFVYYFLAGVNNEWEAWQELRAYWKATRGQVTYTDLATYYQEQWSGDQEVISLLLKVLSRDLGVSLEFTADMYS